MQKGWCYMRGNMQKGWCYMRGTMQKGGGVK